MANLREEILKLTNPAPVFKDPEDNSDDETCAKVVDQSADGPDEIIQPSRLRQKTALILGETDKRYAGKRTSRKNLNSDTIDSGEEFDESNDDLNDFADETSDDGGEDDIGNGPDEGGIGGSDDDDDADENAAPLDDDFNGKFAKFGTKEFIFKDDGDYAKYADDDDDDDDDIDSGDDGIDDQLDDGDDGGDDDDDSGQGDEDDSVVDSEDEGIQKFSQAASGEVAKGVAAKLQLGLWDTLLEGRIKLQKALSVVNQLPQNEAWSDFSETSDSFTQEASKAEVALEHLLASLVHLQDLLLHQNAETKHMVDENSSAQTKHLKYYQALREVERAVLRTALVDCNSNNLDQVLRQKTDDHDDDEEIPSDSDMEIDEQEDKPKLKTEVRKRKLTMDQYPGFLKKRHDGFKEYRNATIQKWYDKTRLAAGKMTGKSFSAFDQSAVAQINQILGDKERLVKRTQLKRTVYRVLGTKPEPDAPEQLPDPSQQGQEGVPEKDQFKDHDVEIFDDDDFYHQLLRELIERKTSDVNDPVALSRQWLEIQKLRSKNKKKVDTKASKGRKVRYDIHKKMANFMAPFDNCEWSHEARDDLFKSLFGKRFSSQPV